MNSSQTIIPIEKVDKYVKVAFYEFKQVLNDYMKPENEMELKDLDNMNNDILKVLDNFYVSVKNEASNDVYLDMLSAFHATDSDILRQEIQQKSKIQIIRG